MQAGPRRNVRAEAARNEPRTRTLERVKKRVNLYLASRSPRRRELLAGLGFRFEALDVEVDEARTPGETPARYVERVARKKVFAGLEAVEGMPGSGAGGRERFNPEIEGILQSIDSGTFEGKECTIDEYIKYAKAMTAC